MDFPPTKGNQCVMMRENLKTESSEYIAVYVMTYVLLHQAEFLDQTNLRALQF